MYSKRMILLTNTRNAQGLWSGRAMQKLMACLLVLLCSTSLPAAQTSAETYWQKIEEADARITASKTTWKRTYTSNPQPDVNVEAYVARVKEQWRQQGASDDLVQSVGEDARRSTQMQASGYAQTTTLAFLHRGAVTRCDVMTDAPFYKGSSPSFTGSHIVNFYDGQNAIALDGFDKVGQFPKRGELTRNKDDALQDSARGFTLLPLLVGEAVTRSFSPSNSSLKMGSNNTVILQKRLPGQIPKVLNLTVSRQTWRIIALDVLYPLDKYYIGQHYAVTGYKLYLGDIYFPSRVIITNFRRNARGRISSVIDHRLLEAAFNEAVDTSDLRIPSGTALNDRRFGGRGVNYVVKDKLPSDETIRKLITQQETDEKAALAQNQRAASLPITLGLGALFMTLGVVLWMRSRRAESA